MDTPYHRIEYLFQRYQSGEATAAERREFMDIIRSGIHKELLQQLIDRDIEDAEQAGPTGGSSVSTEQSEPTSASSHSPEQSAPANTPSLSEETSHRIFSRIVGSVPLPAERLPIRRIPGWIGWAGAAAIVIAALVNLPFLKHRKHETAIADGQPAKYDAAPGKTSAVLTLAGGQQIELDSAAGGTISRQGNMMVINMKGTLAYNATSPATTTSPTAIAPTANNNTATTSYNTLTTNPGNQYQLVLPDGSHIWLNAASSVKFPVNFSNRERSVEISGEAYFEIAPDSKRPFLVHYKDMTVQVLGTHFNINAYTDEQTVATTLLEGSVKVIRGSDQTLITPGQQVQMNSKSMKVLSDINMEEVVAWKNDEFYFHRADIRGIMRQLSRWYNIKVDYEGQEIEERFYAKIPRSAPLSEALKALSLTGKVHFRTGEKTITVYP